jgi:hypothetical protein
MPADDSFGLDDHEDAAAYRQGPAWTNSGMT